VDPFFSSMPSEKAARRVCVSYPVEVRDVQPESPPGVSAQARTVARIGPGRGLFLTEAVKGGDTILVDDPVMIYVDEGKKRNTCANCFRMKAGNKGELPCSCGTCGQAWFCSTECQAASARATPGQGHSPQECALLHKMSRMSKRLGGQEGITLARMLIKAALIKAHDTVRWRQLQDLCAPDGLEDHACDWGVLCLRITELGGECAALGGAQARLVLQRDASNGMGILSKMEEGAGTPCQTPRHSSVAAARVQCLPRKPSQQRLQSHGTHAGGTHPRLRMLPRGIGRILTFNDRRRRAVVEGGVPVRNMQHAQPRVFTQCCKI